MLDLLLPALIAATLVAMAVWLHYRVREKRGACPWCGATGVFEEDRWGHMAQMRCPECDMVWVQER